MTIKEFFKRAALIRYVCKKYNVNYNPISPKGCGSYLIYERGPNSIIVNFFDEYFYETFFHELGHLITYDRVLKKFNLDSVNVNVPACVFYSETSASRFACKILKTNRCKVYLRRCFSSYLVMYINMFQTDIDSLMILKLVDLFSFYERRISK